MAAADVFREVLETGLEELGLGLDPDSISILCLHAAELARWRKRADLTSLSDPRLQAIRLYLDSFTALDLPPRGASIADIGTGAGFPGFPLAVARPDLQVQLVDSRSVKAAFLGHVLGRTQVPNARVVEGRASTVAGQQGPVDVVIARAFAAPDRTRAEAAPWLEAGGQLLLMRGPSTQGEELAPDEPFELTEVFERTLPIEGAPRRILAYRKL